MSVVRLIGSALSVAVVLLLCNTTIVHAISITPAKVEMKPSLLVGETYEAAVRFSRLKEDATTESTYTVSLDNTTDIVVTPDTFVLAPGDQTQMLHFLISPQILGETSTVNYTITQKESDSSAATVAIAPSIAGSIAYAVTDIPVSQLRVVSFSTSLRDAATQLFVQLQNDGNIPLKPTRALLEVHLPLGQDVLSLDIELPREIAPGASQQIDQKLDLGTIDAGQYTVSLQIFDEDDTLLVTKEKDNVQFGEIEYVPITQPQSYRWWYSVLLLVGLILILVRAAHKLKKN